MNIKYTIISAATALTLFIAGVALGSGDPLHIDSHGVTLSVPGGWEPVSNPAKVLPQHNLFPGFKQALERRCGVTRCGLLTFNVVSPKRAPDIVDDHILQDYVNRTADGIQAGGYADLLEQRVVTREGYATLGLLRMLRQDAPLLEELQLRDEDGIALDAVEQVNLIMSSRVGLVTVILYRPPLGVDTEDTLLDGLLGSLRAPPLPAGPKKEERNAWLWISVTLGLVFAVILGLRLYFRGQRRGERAIAQLRSTSPEGGEQTPRAPWEDDIS